MEALATEILANNAASRSLQEHEMKRSLERRKLACRSLERPRPSSVPVSRRNVRTLDSVYFQRVKEGGKGSSPKGKKRKDSDLPSRTDKRTGEQRFSTSSSGSLAGYEAKYPPLEFIENLASPPDYVFKILVVGNSYVGKSTFLMRLCTNAFSARYSSTIGVDFYSKALRVDDSIISVQLWDTAGQERYQAVTKAYYRGAQGVILMYDVSQEESFIAVKSWINSIQDNMKEMPVGMLLVGNKVDLDEQNEREVSTETGETFAKIYGADFMETSAKTGYNVATSLMMLIRVIKRYYEEESTETRHERGIQVNEKDSSSKCCSR